MPVQQHYLEKILSWLKNGLYNWSSCVPLGITPACCHQVPLHVLSRRLFSLRLQPHPAGGQWKREGGLRLTCLDLSLSVGKALSLYCKSLSRGLSPRVHACFSAFIFKTLTNVFQMRSLLCFPFLYYTLLQFVNTGYRCYLRPHLKKKRSFPSSAHLSEVLHKVTCLLQQKVLQS